MIGTGTVGGLRPNRPGPAGRRELPTDQRKRIRAQIAATSAMIAAAIWVRRIGRPVPFSLKSRSTRSPLAAVLSVEVFRFGDWLSPEPRDTLAIGYSIKLQAEGPPALAVLYTAWAFFMRNARTENATATCPNRAPIGRMSAEPMKDSRDKLRTAPKSGYFVLLSIDGHLGCTYWSLGIRIYKCTAVQKKASLNSGRYPGGKSCMSPRLDLQARYCTR